MRASRRKPQTSARRAAAPGLIATDSLPWEEPLAAVSGSDLSAARVAPVMERATAPTVAIAPTVAARAAPFPAPRWSRVDLICERPWGDKPPRGDEWRVLAYFPDFGKWFAGTGPTVWSALAEMIDDWHRRGVRGLAFSPARTA